MKPLSFRLRIALSSAAISGAVLIGFGLAGYLLVSRERLASLDLELRALAHRHPGWAGGGAGVDRWVAGIESLLGPERTPQLILLLKDGSGSIRYMSPHWPVDFDPAGLDLTLADAPDARDWVRLPPETDIDPGRRQAEGRRGPAWATGREPRDGMGLGLGRRRGGLGGPFEFAKVPRFLTVTTSRSDWRIGILGDNGDRLIVGMNLSLVQAELRRLRDRFLIGLPLALALVGYGGWWVAGRAVRPLRSIAQVAERVTSRGLDQRIPAWEDDPEIARLVRVLNGMMDRLEISFQQATRFGADASHELKTPLAVMQGELEHALQAASPGSQEQQVFATLLEETQRLKSITGSLLLLAQADAGRLPLEPARIDLSAAVSELIEDVEVQAAQHRVRVESVVEPDVWVEVDWPLLRQALLNLLQNSLRHNQPDGWIRVTLSIRDESVQFRVSNSGACIPPEDQARLFDRFFRVDAARGRENQGAGLGLSLAREIVRAHQGSLVLEESSAGRTCFCLALPARASGR
jgi:two-component system, OmpR family, heavy metal sensor histidine kinase CusS